jgi:Tfp pilus assembly protein PilW
VTLIELVVALSLTTIVMVAATSVMFVASRALPRPADAVVRATDATLALALFESEAQSAVATRAAANTFLIRIPDRTGDTIPEDIAYGWSGTPGDPLTRNDGVTNSDLITGVQSAVFEWTPARASPTRLGTLYLTLTLERGLVLRSAVRLPSEPENNL